MWCLFLLFREKLRDASNEVQKKSCVIEEMESRMFSSGETHLCEITAVKGVLRC